MNEPTAEQLVASLNQQLTQALIAKDEAQAQVEASTKQIAAIRNVLAGIQVAAKSFAASAAPASDEVVLNQD